MLKQYDVTVIVGTYNPQWDKLRATLLSILKQRNVFLEIIVSDDGSLDPLHAEIKALFLKKGFKDYKLIACEKNEGTVSQFYRAVCAADAEYVKLISPGDLLYDDMVLTNWLKFTIENKADVAFGDAVFYNRKNEEINIIRHAHHPRNMSIYKKKSSYYDKVINYICLGDGISGATKIAKKDILLHYLGILLGRVIYLEDFFLRLALIDKRKIMYFPFTVIWYEFGDGGISTTGESKWLNLMRKDHLEMNKICIEKSSALDAVIKKWLLENSEFKRIKKPSLFERLKYLKHPKWLYWKVYAKLFCEFSPVDVDEEFIKECFKQF